MQPCSTLFELPEARDYAALLAGQTAHRSGREWRTLEDTAISAQLLYYAPGQWQSLRRAMDYYDEALFIWLEADTIIRRKTEGKRSLDDFCRVFFGTPSTPGTVKTYILEDVITGLNSVTPYDWKTFFTTRLNATGADRAPLDGLGASGWSLVYGNSVGSVQSARDEVHQTVEERFSLGFLLLQDGTITDVVRDSAAWKAGLGPDMKVVTVNQRPWSTQALRDAIAADGGSSIPMSLSVQNGSLIFRAEIDDHRGARYPRLERNASTDVMSDILKAHAGVGATP